MNIVGGHVLARARAAVAAMLLLLAAGCSTSDSTASTAPTDPGAPAAMADLEGLLPKADEVGSGYRADPSSSDRSSAAAAVDSFKAALDKQCPDAARYLGDDLLSDQDVRHTYLSSAGGWVEVQLSRMAGGSDSAAVGRNIAAINRCGKVKASIGGQEATIAMSAQEDSSSGTKGYLVRMALTAHPSELDKAVTLNFIGFSYRVRNVSVTVSAMGGIDLQTLETTPPDQDTAKKVAALLEHRVEPVAAS